MEKLERKTPSRLLLPLIAGVAVISIRTWGGPVRAQELDINAVFWCDAGKKTGEQTEAECTAARETILNTCTSCHAITPIVKAQKDRKGWTAFMKAHRERVSNAAEDVYLSMEKFLQAHYNPQNPVPKLPPELEALGVPPA